MVLNGTMKRLEKKSQRPKQKKGSIPTLMRLPTLRVRSQKGNADRPSPFQRPNPRSQPSHMKPISLNKLRRN